jgi:hypothetical protein
VLDRASFPLTRLWCLYEIGFTPPAKLVLLTHGFSAADIAASFRGVDVKSAKCSESSDENMIREHIHVRFGSLDAFELQLRLRLLLRPTSYEADCTALLAGNDDSWRFEALRDHVGADASSGHRVACVVAGAGAGKSTLSAALCAEKPQLVHACHFCKASDARRQDVNAITRSLSYQLALQLPAFAAHIMSLDAAAVAACLEQQAWDDLLEKPLQKLVGQRVVLLFDALDEAEESSSGVRWFINKLLGLDSDKHAALGVVVTTRPRERYFAQRWAVERIFSPSELRLDASESKLLSLLVKELRRSGVPEAGSPDSISAAYAAFFDVAHLSDAGQRALSVLLAAQLPPSMAQLDAMGALHGFKTLPGFGLLFRNREHRAHVLHKSLTDWLKESRASDLIAAGHAMWADHLSAQLRAWLEPAADAGERALGPAPPKGAYVYSYALAHLDAAGRSAEACALLTRLPWLQTMLREHGVSVLQKEVAAHLEHAFDGDALALLHRTLQLCEKGLEKADMLPAQLVGRLGGLLSTAPASIVRLYDEAFHWRGSLAWLRPMLPTLAAPQELAHEYEPPARHHAIVNAIAELDNWRVATASADTTVRIWDAVSGACERVLEGHTAAVRALAAVRDGRVASASDDGTLRVWVAATGQCLHTLHAHPTGVTDVVALPDGLRLLSGSKTDDALHLWDATDGSCLRTMHSTVGDELQQLIVLADGRVVVHSLGSSQHSAAVWNVNLGTCDLQRSFGYGHAMGPAAWPDQGPRALQDGSLRFATYDLWWCAVSVEGNGGRQTVTVLDTSTGAFETVEYTIESNSTGGTDETTVVSVPVEQLMRRPVLREMAGAYPHEELFACHTFPANKTDNQLYADGVAAFYFGLGCSERYGTAPRCLRLRDGQADAPAVVVVGTSSGAVHFLAVVPALPPADDDA